MELSDRQAIIRPTFIGEIIGGAEQNLRKCHRLLILVLNRIQRRLVKMIEVSL